MEKMFEIFLRGVGPVLGPKILAKIDEVKQIIVGHDNRVARIEAKLDAVLGPERVAEINAKFGQPSTGQSSIAG